MKPETRLDSLRTHFQHTQLTADEIGRLSRKVHEILLSDSKFLDHPNFSVVHTDDLRLLFHCYDEIFFSKQCSELLGEHRLDYRLSKRMTSAGGKTTRTIYRTRTQSPVFEIAVSTTLLFQTFAEVDRPILVTGIECQDRLQALQRIFEHELIHLIELLLWEKSKCSQMRFQSMAARFFGHTDYHHQLVTPREHALATHGIHLGSRVQFEFEGVQSTGIVNRITRRATVLVEDRTGQRFTDGKYYKKYYVPLEYLTLVK